jgi:predicted DNA-binding transcriptional regulator YafY
VRADRLVAILLLLQRRNQVTAAEVAEELEISERTARRDLDALGMAGLPVYPIRGRGGGWRMLGGGRTDLSGLSETEVRALFLVAGPAAASPQVKAALRKLVRALPEPFRPSAEAASSAVMVDHGGWDRAAAPRPPPPHLDALQRAVIDGRRILLGYVARDRSVTARIVDPLGLVAKGQVWYLVAGTEAGLRTFRADRVKSVEQTDEPVVRPDGFDLAETWQGISEKVDQMRAPFQARAAAEPWVVQVCRFALGTRIAIGSTLPDGRVEIELRGHGIHSLAGELAGFGAALEVLDPPELRERMARTGAELVSLYAVAGATRPESDRVVGGDQAR